jgi:hypothetical protein
MKPMSDSLTVPAFPVVPEPKESAPATEERTAELSPAVAKFKSCRWRRPPEDGPECCGHRDVLPIAGTSFNPEAWCPDCTFFKLRRTPKKRSPEDYRY